jgi:PAS domain S-box-containing protein
MTNWEFQLRGVDDPRLAVHATRQAPAWLWSTDGSRVLWANPVAARVFGAANAADLAHRPISPADPHRRQVAQLAGKLPENGAPRLERLRGFGARLGALATCACTRLEFADGSAGVLIVAADAVGRPMPLIERLRGLVEGIDTPIAAFARDGLFIGSSDAARALLGFRNLSEAGLDQAREDALRLGRAETPIGLGHVVLRRVGSGADVGLIALLEPGPVSHPAPEGETVEPVPQPAPPEIIAEPVDEIAEAAAEPSANASGAEAPDAAVPDDESPQTGDEAPAELSLLGETEQAAQTEAVADPPAPEHPAEAEVAANLPAYETFDTTSEAPAEFSLLNDVTDPELAPASETEARPEAEEPSPYVAAVADEPVADAAEADEPSIAEPDSAAEPAIDPALEPQFAPRRHPLRFVWQIDGDERLAIASDDFLRLIGPRTAAQLGARWREIAERLALDPQGLVAAALAARHTWSGITLHWPADGTYERLPIELSGLPVQDRDGKLAGYRGFGVCRDLDALNRLAVLRLHGASEPTPRPLSADRTPPDDVPPAPEPPAADPSAPTSDAIEPDQRHNLDTPVDTPKNVLPFRPANDDARTPSLTPVENSAFHELARQLAARLEHEDAPAETEPTPVMDAPAPDAPTADVGEAERPAAPQAEWLAPMATPAKGDSGRDRVLLDLMPVGVLIYRLDRLLYANAAFLARMGFASLAALEDAGGLDALFVEAGITGSSSSSETGTPITIAATQGSQQSAPTQGRLFTIDWDGDQALALIFSASAEPALEIPTAPSIDADATPPVGAVNAEELGAILDTTAEGVLLFDEAGQISAANRSGEALFGYDGEELIRHNLIDLFAPESRQAVLDYLDSIKTGSAQSLLDHGLEALGRVRAGGLFPLTMTIGRTRADGPNFFAVFRDLSQVQKTETELSQAKQIAERAADAKAGVLARLSHEIRAPLNAIIGFAEVMIEERFGALGNERYVDYMKDIRASGERVIGIVDDLLNLSRIETGKLDLAFVSQNLNEVVESCVALMQPRANRERIIIRTSLAHLLPPVVADAPALRQIIMNLIGTAIHLANAGGQVIVSTALSDFGEVVLRVRDTGARLNDDELAAALQPFRSPAPGDRSEASGVSLSLTKALVEANRAQFHIKSAPQSGTLIEVVFSHAPAQA